MQLGEFQLQEPIGHGGMGMVWSGEHVAEEIPVAVKIVRPKVMDEPSYLEAFDNEVRAVASLNHPNIVTVLDYGRVTPSVADAADEAVRQGAPYLVMEYARGGSVADYFGDIRWPDLRELLLVTLDGLAHAHARDVIHRDLKPENVLVGCGQQWEVKISDFGLAHATDQFRDSGQVEGAWGTPQYMAPEQLRGLWREYGPWTDLYGLGCMAFELITGRWPYDGDSMVEIANAHLEESIPGLTPRFEVPEGTEDWIRKLLAKERGGRFEHAADAAHGLARLPALDDGQSFGVLFEPPERGEETVDVGEAGPATLVLPDVASTRGGDDRKPPAPRESSAAEAAVEADFETPALPLDWRRDIDPAISDELLGISLGLFGLRAIPLVDRQPERDRMWDLLVDVDRRQSARQLIVEGRAGTGKSELARWLCRRAREVGAARVLRAYHSPVSGPADGLVAMVERFLRCTKLEGEARRDHLGDLLVAEGLVGDVELRTLVSLLEDRGATASQEGSMTGRVERYGIIYDLLSALAEDRPILLWLDDVQWGWDALGFAHYVQSRQESRPAPLGVVMTVNWEAIDRRTTESRLLDTLRSREGVESLEVAPLAPGDTEKLVRRLLRLDDELADEVLERSEGIPLFAVQLVEDWVSRGKLRMGAEGFELRKGAEVSVPDDIYRLWDGRLEGVVRDESSDSYQALELAAALGKEVDGEEFERAVELAGLSVPADLVERLVKRDLADRLEDSWQFGHGLLRDSLERRARESGRWTQWNVSCARAIEALYDADELEVPERLASHWLEAGRRESGLEQLGRAIDQAIERSDYRHALDLIDRRDEASPEETARWTVLDDIDRARVASRRGEYRRCVELARRAGAQARESGLADLAARAQLLVGVGRRSLGNLDGAREALVGAEEHFEGIDQELLARAALQRGRVEQERADYEQARQYFEWARSLYEQLSDTFGRARCLNAIGDVRRRSGDLQGARQASLQALEDFEEIDNITGIADCLDDLAGLARLNDNYDQAHDHAEKARRLYAAVGSEQRHAVRLNQAMIWLERTDYTRAADEFRDLIEIFENREQPARIAEAIAGLLAADAGRGRWDAWCRRLEAVEEVLAETDVHTHEVLRALREARRLARDEGRTEVVDRIRSLVRSESRSIRPARSGEEPVE